MSSGRRLILFSPTDGRYSAGTPEFGFFIFYL
jgi:hypothetical protein